MQGYLLGRDHLAELGRMVRENHSKQGRRPQRRRQQVFQQSAGTSVYQCVHGTRLRSGTTVDEDKLDKREPVCLAVRIGDTSTSDLRNLKHEHVKRIREIVIAASGIDADGLVVQKAIDGLRGDSVIDGITSDQLGSAQSVQTLRTRFSPNYVCAGSIVVGNDDEVWGGGAEIYAATTDSIIHDSVTSGLYIAKLSINQPAIDAGIASASDLIQEYVVVRDRIAAGATLINPCSIGVQFAPQPWFDDDSSYSPEYWYDTGEYGWLPVFCVVNRPTEMIGKSDAAVTAPATGTFSIWTGTSSALLTDSDENMTAYVRYGDIAITKWCNLTAYSHGWEATIAEC